MDRGRGAADRRQQNILPTGAADAPVLDQLVRNLVPPLAAGGQPRVSPIRRAQGDGSPLTFRHDAFLILIASCSYRRQKRA